ncbi:MAG: ABC transporter substrate-binding protein, partial [Desulfocapsa sp.]|nr:ABC transporter substrate-binding protein [Desulfocapsa sp.]
IGSGSVCASEKLVLQLPWHHQFQFAGYYMAEEQGYYRDAGLDVEIRDVTQGSNFVAEVVSGRANFSVGRSGLLVEHSLGKPVVVLATIFQQDPTIFLSLESSGIRKPSDFIGKKVMLMPESQSLSLDVLLHQEGLFGKVEQLKSSYDYHSLLNGETDVLMPTYLMNPIC